jgi:hypothetical protein
LRCEDGIARATIAPLYLFSAPTQAIEGKTMTAPKTALALTDVKSGEYSTQIQTEILSIEKVVTRA